MLSIGKLAAGQEAYYLGKVAEGIEDYYVGGGEAEGRWTGSGAAALGLEGSVSSDQLQAMLAAKNPVTGQPLQDREQTMNGPGFDLTFSAPKSVSLLWAFGDDQVRSRVIAAHEAAVDQALGHLERHAALARRGAGGGTFLQAPNLIGAAYRHRTSRAGDPQLHTHVLVSKLVKAGDGRWTCLHSPSLYANAKTAGFLYQAELRDQLTRTLGVRWGEVLRGTASIEGIEEPAEAIFSRRRSEIEAAQAASGTGTRASWQSSTLETRKAKNTDLEAGELEADWIGTFIAERSGYDTAKGAGIYARSGAKTGRSTLVTSSHPSLSRRLEVVLAARSEIHRQRAAGLTPRLTYAEAAAR